MTDTAAFKLVFRCAEAHANGHEKCREILLAITRCKQILQMAGHCSQCRRRGELGKLCNLIQPDGSRCVGFFVV